ncbi:tyrosine-type recombinase/integrase [Pseudoalteromonas sp. C2R02]|uniref:tyrosine-type recombinase/integrase n=1 Tax=Pseudoalteromonas sp. C2R02 TaxID=2841565 RepID=UPI001C0841F0|nr:tyrosine-type recombinase/integrase [Pseudoalteromonas sp. C2R02]MBU2969984.1 tyrosine-type recombinase/integrase [Pseudoalteromonas sp. C2R02]
MSFLIKSADIYKKTQLSKINEKILATPIGGNIGSLPTLFTKGGKFNREANSYIFYKKVIRQAVDLQPCSQALQDYYQFLEDNNLHWNKFPPIKRLKPTYLFRSHLLKKIKKGTLAHSTASIRMNQIVNYYKWLLHDGFLAVNNEKEAPFKMEFVSIKTIGILAHISPKFIIESSDLRIKVPRDSETKTVRSLTPLSQAELDILTDFLPEASQELKLQILISIDTGLRIQEVATISLNAIKSARPLAESEYRSEFSVAPQLNGVQTKYGNKRTIEISKKLLDILNEYCISERRLKRVNKLDKKLNDFFNSKLELNEKTAISFKRCLDHEPLFVSEQGNPVSPKSIEARWSELRAKIKIIHPSFTHRFHDFRSTYGTYRLSDLLSVGLHTTECLELLMGWMGHKNESTTMKYIRFLKRREAFKVKFGILDSIMHHALGGEDE